jgi:hypothetical protein
MLGRASYEAALEGHFVSDSCQAFPCRIFGHAADLVKNLSGLDDGRPVFRFAFSFAHAGLGGLGGN